MAILKNCPVGKLSGKIGPNVYRISKGRIIVAAAPAAYTTSQTPKAVRSRNILYSYSKFSSAVNKILTLARIWNETDFRGSTSYRKIVNFNSKKLNGEFLSVNNLIAPRTLKDPVKSMNLTSNNLDVILADDAFEPSASNFTLHILLALIKPKKAKTAFIFTKPLFMKIDKDQFTVSFELDKTFTIEVPKYTQLIVYPCLTFSENNRTNWFTDSATLFNL
jgi:hypothetical protein